MSSLRRFSANSGVKITDLKPFIFTIDTNNIVPTATNGAENPLTFTVPIPINSSNNTRMIVETSDGQKVSWTSASSSSSLKLTFPSAGIYQITIRGLMRSWSFYFHSIDVKKIISIDQFSDQLMFTQRAFNDCINLTINATNCEDLKLAGTVGWFFQRIKGFSALSNLGNMDASAITNVDNMFSTINQPLTSFPSQWTSLTSLNLFLAQSKIDSNAMPSIVLNCPAVTSISQPFNSLVYTGGELILNTPNATKIFRYFWGAIQTKEAIYKVDVRNVTDASDWMVGAVPTSVIDAMLIYWADNLPSMKAGVTWNFAGNSHSSDPLVLDAISKITQVWGAIFTNLNSI